ncbi:Fc.00g076580.m01.CDS01 [Cosmosporella sp. VM-42]
MGLVDYSDSDSGSEVEAPVKAPPKSTSSTSKKPFQKVVDRSNPGKIVVNLPQTSTETKTSSDEPPTKRARTVGGGRFSGFNSFLPAPKNANKQTSAASGGSARSGFSFKTSAAPGFSREGGDDGAEGSSGGLNLPPPKAQAQPSIPEGQKPEEEVKLVGKPLMFKPLSVARGKKKVSKAIPAAKLNAQASTQGLSGSIGKEIKSDTTPALAPKKVSLFSLHTEEASEATNSSNPSGAYEPLFAAEAASEEYNTSSYGDYAQYAQTGPAATTALGIESLDTVADDLNLSAAERRQFFGRGGIGNQGATKVINFNMDKEYEHNEEIRAAGEQQTHNPVRAIQGGKHSLRQLVQNVQNQKEALEDSFAKGKTNRKEASSRYGW